MQAVELTKLLALLAALLTLCALAAYIAVMGYWVSRTSVCSGAQLRFFHTHSIMSYSNGLRCCMYSG